MIEQLEARLQSLPVLKPRLVFTGFPRELEREFMSTSLRKSLWLIRFSLLFAGFCMFVFGIINNLITPPEEISSWLIPFTIIRVAVISPYFLFGSSLPFSAFSIKSLTSCYV